MIRYIDSANNISNSLEGKAWPHYDVLVKLNNGLRIIRNGIGQFVYALIDDGDNLIIQYSEDEIKVIDSSEFLKISNRISSEIRIFDFKGNEIIKVPCSNVEYIDGFFIVSKSFNKYGRDNSQLYGLYSKDGEEIYPIVYNAIISIAPNILKLTKEKDSFSSQDSCENFLWFVNEDKKVDIPVGNIDLINNDSTLFVHPLYDEEQHYNTRESGYMLLSSSGKILSPKNTLDIGFFNEDGIATISVKSEIYGIWQHDGFIDWNGNLYHRCNSKLRPMPTGFDWVSDFQNDIADTYIGKYTGHINLDYQKVVKIQKGNHTKFVPLPDIYSSAVDSDCEFIQVIKDDLMGIISCDGDEIIPTTYLHIDIVSDQKRKLYRFVCYKANETYVHEDYYGIHCHRNADIYDNHGDKLNISAISNPVYLGFGLFRCNCTEEKIRRRTPNYNGEFETLNLQIINSQCHPISELKFSEVLRFGESRKYSEPHMEDENAPYAIFMRGDTWGAINSEGQIVLRDIQNHIEIKDIPSLLLKDGYSPSLFKVNEFKVPFNHNYESIEYVGYGLFRVTTDKSYLNDKWDKSGTTYVDIFNHALAPTHGHVSEIKNNLFISYVSGNGIYKRSVINIHGDIIIPYCDYQFEIHNNFILAYDSDHEPILYSLEGNIIVAKGRYRNGHTFKDFLDRFIKISWNTDYYNYVHLIDKTGKAVYDNCDQYFSDYEQIIPGILKIKVSYGEGYRFCIGDFNGRIRSKSYEQIDFYKNGLCRVSIRKATGYNEYNGHETYSYFYGVIRITGEEVIPINYRSVEVFEQENIIKTDVGDMTFDGRFITFYDSPEGKTQLILDAKYDYCLPFDGEYAIVCADNKFGLINTTGSEVFPLICSKIVFLENKFYKFKINGLWGIFNTDKGLILGNRYSKIEDFNNGIAKVSVSKSTKIRYYGVISLSEELLKPKFSLLRILTNSIVACAYGGEAGFAAKWILYDLSKRQKIIIDKAISYIGNLSEGLIRICKTGLPCRKKHGTSIVGGKWGYINIDGELSILPTYDKCMDFLDNIAPVRKNNKWGFIDRLGNIIVPFEYDDIEKNDSYYTGIKMNEENKDWFRFNSKGSIIENGKVVEEDSCDYDDTPYYEDTPSIYDNPYYNDNLDMDQQSIDFWNSL